MSLLALRVRMEGAPRDGGASSGMLGMLPESRCTRMVRFDVSRTRFIEQARIAFVLDAFSGLHFPNTHSSSWAGGSRVGTYVHSTHSGNCWAFAWDERGLVALAFDHESRRSEYDQAEKARKPLRWLKKLPPSLFDLAERTAGLMERLATAGLWIAGKRHGLSDAWKEPYAHGLEYLRGYALPAEEAVFGDTLRQNWLELVSLSEEQGRLAIRFAQAAGRGPVEVSAEDEAVLLHPPDGEGSPEAQAAVATAEALRTVGIHWSPPIERLTQEKVAREEAHRARTREALGGLNVELFEAARCDDAPRVRTLLDRGADMNCRTVENQWPYTPAGDTPLLQSLKAKAWAAAATLIEAGADLASQNRMGQTALMWAVRGGNEALVGSLIARGANVNTAAQEGTTALHEAAMAGSEAIVRLLREAGANTAARRWDGRTPAECAPAAGHPAIVRLLG